MNDEIKQRALKLLEEQCPDELEIYNRWERCIEMYSKGFRSIPQPMSELIEWFNPNRLKSTQIGLPSLVSACILLMWPWNLEPARDG